MSRAIPDPRQQHAVKTPTSMHTEHFGENTPLGRPAQPVEMAPIYVLLASTESSYVTGMVYGATGGQPMP